MSMTRLQDFYGYLLVLYDADLSVNLGSTTSLYCHIAPPEFPRDKNSAYKSHTVTSPVAAGPGISLDTD